MAALLAILAIPATNIMAYNWEWDQGHDCVEGKPGKWGRFDYVHDNPEDAWRGDYISKECCEELCQLCPVYANTGEYQQPYIDLSVPGIGPVLTIVRTYNSMDWSSSLFGHSWIFSLGRQLIIAQDQDGKKILGVRLRTGERNYFREHSDGTIEKITDYGVPYTLTKNDDGTYTILNKSGSSHELNSDGKINRIVDRNGNALTFQYNSVGCLQRITNASGNYVDIQLGPNGKIASISDNLGRTVSYGYDESGNLISVTDPMGNTTQYVYDTRNLLTQIINARGNTIASIGYESSDPPRVSTFTEKGETYTVAYFDGRTEKTDSQGSKWTYYYNDLGIIERVIDPLGNDKTQQHNKVTSTSLDWQEDLNGNRTTYTYNDDGNINSKTDSLGNTWSFTYASGSNLKTETTDPLGVTTHYEYDSNGNVTRVDRNYGGSLENATVNTYDSQGNLTSATNPLGNTTVYEYDANGKLTRITDPSGGTTAYTYDLRGNKSTVTNAKGNVTSYAYDLMGRLLTSTDPLGNTKTYTYDAVGNMTSVFDSSGNTIAFEYDNYDRLVRQIDPLGNVLTFGYDSKGNITSLTDSNGNTTSYAYDVHYKLTKTTDALGNEIRYAYDAEGNLLSITDKNGQTTSFVYNELDQRISETNAAGEITSYNYDSRGNLISTALPNGNTIIRTYDALSRVIRIEDSMGVIETITYNAAGNVITKTDSLGNTTSFAYDENNRLIRITGPMSQSITFEYDETGKMISRTDKEGTITLYSYNALGQKTSITDALGNTTSYNYDASGNLASITDANGNVTSYTYDSANRLVREAFADGTYISYSYDALGNRISRTDQNGQTTAYVYNALNQLILADYPGENDINNSYDNMGNLVSSSNQNIALTFAYDSVGRLIQEAQGNKIVSFIYDLANNKKTTTYPGGISVSQVRDLRGRLSKIEDGSSNSIAEYVYDSSSRLVGRNYINGVQASLIKNVNGWVTDIAYTAGGVQLFKFQYGHDRTGNTLFSKRLHNLENSSQYTYDADHRLIQDKTGVLNDSGSIPSPSTQTDYGLDGLGNWLSKTSNTTTQTRSHNEMNELVNLDGSAVSYDNNGNLVDDGTNAYEYDFENRLIKVTRKSDNVLLAEYLYGPFGRRIEKNISGVQSVYIYTGARVIEELNEADSVENAYVYGNGIDEVVCLMQAGNSYYYISDQLGSTIALADSSGSVIEEYSYDSYGKSSDISSLGNPYMFTGRRLDDETGLYYYRMRHYNTDFGRFMQRDPIGYGDSMNLYEYVRSNPLRWTDPSGTKIHVKDCIDDLLRSKGAEDFSGGKSGDYWEYIAEKTSSHGSSLEEEIYWRMVTSDRTFIFETIDQLKRVVAARLNIVSTAENVPFKMGTGSSPLRWIGTYFIGNAASAINSWWSGNDYKTGCTMGTELVMLKGVLNQLGASRFNSISGNTHNIGGSKVWTGLSGKFTEDNPASNKNDWIAGDWGYVNNLSPNPDSFLEGENIIYLGGSFEYSNSFANQGNNFWGLWSNGGRKRSLSAWESDVSGWNNNAGAEIWDMRRGPKHSNFNY